ncbi:hypothetical protein [Chromobacterium vaccinii]|uniref:hypothetical protein n=1 Tax=Chromobacterium vaccinii TaxID=1108595 RepID=UPI0011C02A00|nr:hypothetical protein [Chromobacterium vaccinii]
MTPNLPEFNNSQHDQPIQKEIECEYIKRKLREVEHFKKHCLQDFTSDQVDLILNDDTSPIDQKIKIRNLYLTHAARKLEDVFETNIVTKEKDQLIEYLGLTIKFLYQRYDTIVNKMSLIQAVKSI